MAEILETTQQIVLSVRIKGDAGPQTGDVVLGAASFGDFDEMTKYDKNEIVVRDGNLYRAKDTIDPGEFNPDQWELLTDVDIRLRDFQPNHEYLKDTTCLYQEKLWRAKEDFTTGDEFDPDDWDGIDTVDVDVMDFTPKGVYDKYEMIAHNGKLYRAKKAFIATNQWLEKDWEIMGDLIVDDFKPNTDYHKDNVVIVSGAFYRAKEDFTSGATFDPGDWEKLSAVGIGDFAAETYYAEGAVITHNNKIYVAKHDFTSGATFDDADWQVQSDTVVDTFRTGTFYTEHHLVFYNGNIYRAREEFTSGTAFDPDDWEELTSQSIPTFEPNKYYYQNDIIQRDGRLYVAKRDFTAGNTFNPSDWTELNVTKLQSVYENSSDDFTDPTIIRPQTGKTFEEHLCAPDSDSHVLAFADNSAGTQTLRDGVVLDQGASALLNATRTGANRDTAAVTVSHLDAKAEMVVKQQGGDPWAEFHLTDNTDQEFSIVVNDGNSSVTMSDEIQNAFTAALAKASATQYGVVKVDGKSIKAEDGVISAIANQTTYNANASYIEGELVWYNGKAYVAKQDFTSGANFNIANWYPIRPVVETYTTGQAYALGDLIQDGAQLYFCKVAISSAPANRDSSYWTAVKIGGVNVVLNTAGNTIATSTVLNTAVAQLDSVLSTSVQPADNTTKYIFTTQNNGTPAPSPVAGKTIVCLFTE